MDTTMIEVAGRPAAVQLHRRVWRMTAPSGAGPSRADSGGAALFLKDGGGREVKLQSVLGFRGELRERIERWGGEWR